MHLPRHDAEGLGKPPHQLGLSNKAVQSPLARVPHRAGRRVVAGLAPGMGTGWELLTRWCARGPEVSRADAVLIIFIVAYIAACM